MHGQLKNSVITGKISDVTSQEALIGAIVKVGKQGTTTDVEGNYKLRLEPGKYTITYSYIGFKPETKVLELKENDSLEINIALKDQSALDEVVVSAGRYEQKIGEVTISMEILKPALLENKKYHTIRCDHEPSARCYG
ncbi:MAG: carboxypeptidase-like regulatory domain-containing protein [Sphingobacteriaceae bacterium]|nr:carboxypeptidase-like regulatory domain-containing protein [Sphingobacteriaceae bacterium]